MLEMEDVDDLCLDFTITKECFGQTIVTELKDGGEDIEVDDDNKHEYIALLVRVRWLRGLVFCCRSWLLFGETFVGMKRKHMRNPRTYQCT